MSSGPAGPTAAGPAPGTRLWLVRHGHTVWHGTGGVAGRTDVELSDAGREAVRALGPSLGARLGACRSAGRAVRWWVSPMSRARETHRLLRAGAGDADADASEDARLVELDFGDWEGSTWADVHRDHGALLAAWGEDWVGGAPPNGETFGAQAARAGAWLDEATGAAGDGVTDAFAVAHGGTIRALLSLTLGHPLQRAMRFAIDPASVTCVERTEKPNGEGGWLLRLSNAMDFGD